MNIKLVPTLSGQKMKSEAEDTGVGPSLEIIYVNFARVNRAQLSKIYSKSTHKKNYAMFFSDFFIFGLALSI